MLKAVWQVESRQTGASERQLHDARDRFLSAEEPDAGAVVREPIRQSWARSRALTVHPHRAESQFIREPNTEATLIRAAAPILAQLAANLATEPVAVVLTTADGVITQRITSDRAIKAAMDDVRLARGYSYLEQFVGTNGIGTALEMRMPALVLGREHYTDGLAALSCAGVPILHPVSGKLLGVLDLTTWAVNGGSLLMTLARTAAGHIQDRILSQALEAETAPFNGFLKASRRTSQAILALGGDQVLMNRKLRASLDGQDLASLTEYALESTDPADRNFIVPLPSGRTVRLSTESLDPDDKSTVFTVQLLKPARTPALSGGMSRQSLPGLAGKSPSWRRSQREVDRCYRDGGWFLVAGEPGSGRTALLRSVAAQFGSPARFEILSPADARSREEYLNTVAAVLEEGDFELLLRDINTLPADLLDPLTGLLQAAEGRGRLMATVDSTVADPDFEVRIQPFFKHTVGVSALRHRIEDLDELVPHLLGKAAQQPGTGPCVSLSAEAMQHLAKFNWPGNVAQLRSVLREVMLRQRSGVAGTDQLPAEVRALSKHRLTPMEALQRDAIVQALAENDGNMARAAAALGMSRATIYRRKRSYGIR